MLTAREKAAPGDPSRAPTIQLSQQRASKSVRGPILGEFLMPKSDIQKSTIFGILKNPQKLSNQPTRGCPSLGFGTKKLPLASMLASIFQFFSKMAKVWNKRRV